MRKLWSLLIFNLMLLPTVSAYADVTLPAAILYVFANNQFSSVNVVQLNVASHANCNLSGAVSRAYIKKENKELFAAALTAAAQGLTVGLTIKENSDPVSVYGTLPDPLTCEVTQIIIHH